MANRFWVGNSGNMSDPAHWSATSGGAGGASAPTSADNVYFDANSFFVPGQTVTANTISCLDMDWTGAIYNPTFGGNQPISIYGSLTCNAAMNWANTGSINMQATTTGKTITSAGIVFSSSCIFNGVGGGWTLQDDFSPSNITLTSGTLNTNGKTVNTTSFGSSNANTRALILGASVINLSGNWTFTTTTGLTFTANTSKINMTGNTITFFGGGLTYNNVNFTGSPITVTGSNTFNILTIAAGKTLNLTSSTNQTVTSLVCNGNLANPSTLQTLTGGSPATIALPAGRYFIRHTSVKDITVTGATSVTDIGGTNVSGNTGITFVTKFEMGRIKNDGSFNWYSTATGLVTKVSG